MEVAKREREKKENHPLLFPTTHHHARAPSHFSWPRLSLPFSPFLSLITHSFSMNSRPNAMESLGVTGV